ncbi:MAG: dihydroorotate dehydrogenase [Candidatus Firestonebacteria bacterium]|nr:dihydroorotate dehydrogenase [Candidatus Firestonebacteria bacterium]
MPKQKPASLSVRLGTLELRNPVILASGTCGYGTELEDQVDFSTLGALVAKSVTLTPRTGNPMPRVVECAAGMLNAIGLANVGVEAFCREKLPALRRLPCAVIANVAGSTAEEYLKVVARLESEAGLAGLELNVSCPNVHAGGLEFGRDPGVLGELVAAVREITRRPLWVKLTPNVTDIVPLALAAEAAGADALTVSNTLVGMRMDLEHRRPVLANVTGGLSGPAIKPVALNLVYKTAGAVKIPVIGCGGISTASDALEFLMAGESQ